MSFRSLSGIASHTAAGAVAIVGPGAPPIKTEPWHVVRIDESAPALPGMFEQGSDMLKCQIEKKFLESVKTCRRSLKDLPEIRERLHWNLTTAGVQAGLSPIAAQALAYKSFAIFFALDAAAKAVERTDSGTDNPDEPHVVG